MTGTGNKDMEKKHLQKERNTRAHKQCAMCCSSEVIPDLKECIVSWEYRVIFIRAFSSEISSSTQLWLFITQCRREDHEEEGNAPLPPPSYESVLISSDWRITSTYQMLHLYLMNHTIHLTLQVETTTQSKCSPPCMDGLDITES